MKKLLLILFVACFIFSVIGCGTPQVREEVIATETKKEAGDWEGTIDK
ncbi:MAG: hypothetical protein ABIH42_00680 [Planctomycetota bacterium]